MNRIDAEVDFSAAGTDFHRHREVDILGFCTGRWFGGELLQHHQSQEALWLSDRCRLML